MGMDHVLFDRPDHNSWVCWFVTFQYRPKVNLRWKHVNLWPCQDVSAFFAQGALRLCSAGAECFKDFFKTLRILRIRLLSFHQYEYLLVPLLVSLLYTFFLLLLPLSLSLISWNNFIGGYKWWSMIGVIDYTNYSLLLVSIVQWEFQDPKVEVLYHIRPYFWGNIPLHRPYIGLIYGRYLQFRSPEMAIE